MSTYFITATGTDIGKTVITAALVYQLKRAHKNVHALKPVISGFNVHDDQADSYVLAQALGRNDRDIDDITFTHFEEPLSPDMAARRVGRDINYDALLRYCHKREEHDILLIEGAGGVMVPLTERQTSRNLMVDLRAKAILVSGTYLGCMSHLLTAIEALKAAGVPIAGVILNETPESDVPLDETIKSLKNFIDVPILSTPYVPKPHPWQHMPNLLSLIHD